MREETWYFGVASVNESFERLFCSRSAVKEWKGHEVRKRAVAVFVKATKNTLGLRPAKSNEELESANTKL